MTATVAPSLTFHWALPTDGGDGRHIVGPAGVPPGRISRPGNVTYLTQVARAAEDNGFEAALAPSGAWCSEAWLSTAMLSRTSDRLRFIVSCRPGLMAPYLVAQMASTFQNLSAGRLLLNVVAGGEPHEQRMYGDFSDRVGRYARSDEFLEVVRRLWDGETVDFDGKHLAVAGAALDQIPDPVPAIYCGGSSWAAGRVAARHADVYLSWGEPPHAVAEKIAWIRALAAEEGRDGARPIRFGIRMHTITRDTATAAWIEADRLLAEIPDATIQRVQESLRRSESDEQRRMLELHGGSAENLEVYPNVWAGIGLLRGGAGTALVGSHEEVADRIEEYAAIGIEEFILSAFPHLEGAYWFGEGVLPILAERGVWKDPRP